MARPVIYIRRLFYSVAAALLSLLLIFDSGALAAEKVIFVGDFANETGDPKWNGVGIGIANSISVKLSKISSIKVTSVEARRQAMAEQRFGMTGFADAETAAELGKIAGATHIAYGTYTIAGNELMAFAYLVDCSTALTEGSCESFAKTDSTASLISELALGLVQALGGADETAIAAISEGDIGKTIDTLAMEGRIADLLLDENGAVKRFLPREILQEAEAMCAKIISIEPLNPYAHSYMGAIMRELGGENLERGAYHYRKAIEIDPDFIGDYISLGELLIASGDYGGALDVLMSALEKEPDSAPAHVNIGNVHVSTGDFDGAIAWLTRALEIRPNHPLTYVNLALARKKKGDMAGALSDYRKALAIDPDYLYAHIGLANALHESGEKDAALPHALRGVELAPAYDEAHYTLGRIYNGLEEYSKGAAAYERTVEINPGYANAWTALGLCRLKSGDAENAKHAFMKGMELSKPGDWAYDTAVKKLAELEKV